MYAKSTGELKLYGPSVHKSQSPFCQSFAFAFSLPLSHTHTLSLTVFFLRAEGTWMFSHPHRSSDIFQIWWWWCVLHGNNVNNTQSTQMQGVFRQTYKEEVGLFWWWTYLNIYWLFSSAETVFCISLNNKIKRIVVLLHFIVVNNIYICIVLCINKF